MPRRAPSLAATPRSRRVCLQGGGIAEGGTQSAEGSDAATWHLPTHLPHVCHPSLLSLYAEDSFLHSAHSLSISA